MILTTLTTGEWIALAAVFVSIIAPLLYLAFRSGGLFERIGYIKDTIDEIKPDIKLIPVIREKVDVLWKEKYSSSESPMVLNDKGTKILKDSKIENFTNEYYTEIVNQIKERNLQNPYQVQQALIEVVGSYKDKEAERNRLENAAFITGVNVTTVLFVAALNIRDKVINDLGMKVEDIDKFDPKKE